jgi:hypothetical protein
LHCALANGFYGINPPVFQLLASFLQNLISINKIEVADDKFDIKNVTIAVKLVSKFFSKMQEHVDDNSIPKDVPAFAMSFFFKATGGGFTLALKGNDSKKTTTVQPADGTSGGKRKPNGKEQQGQKKPKKEFLDKSLKMDLFHVKRGTPASKELPDKITLKDGAGNINKSRVWIKHIGQFLGAALQSHPKYDNCLLPDR